MRAANRTPTPWLFALVAFACADPYTAVSRDVPDAMVPDGGATPRVLYVSAAGGSESNQGTSRDKPLRSIGAALALQATEGLPSYEIQVCAGDYTETNLQIRRPTTLRGGFNCSTWARSEGFGIKGNFQDPNRTTISSKNEAIASTVLNIESAGDVVLEGFDLVAGAPGAAISAKNSNLVLRDNRVRALAVLPAQATGPTIGVNVVGGSVSISDSEIRGGGGRTNLDLMAASQGIVLSGAAGSIRSSRVFAGTGVAEGESARGAYGISVDTAMDSTFEVRIEDNLIQGEASRVAVATGTSVGVPFLALAIRNTAKVIVARNRILGGRSTSARRGSALGVYVDNVGMLDFTENRVDVGELDTPDSSECYALSVLGAGTTRVFNNALSGGCTESTSPTAYPSSIYARGRMVIAHNSMVGNLKAGRGGLGRGLVLGANADVDVTNNVILASEHAVEFTPCLKANIRALHNNLLAGVQRFRILEGAQCTARADGTIADLGGPQVVRGNIVTETAALEPSPLASIRAAIVGTGTVLPAKSTCSIARGGVDLLSVIPRTLPAPRVRAVQPLARGKPST